MEIRYLGHASFHLKGKDESVVTDPYDQAMTGLKFPKVEAGIVTVSHHHGDHDRGDQVEGNPLVVDIPGEYEKHGVRITGFGVYHDNEKGVKRGQNTMFKIEVDGVSVLHCGDLGHTLSEELAEEIDVVHILLVPVGGFYTIDAREAYEVVKQIEPTIVIPMHYKTDQHSVEFASIAPLAEFLKVMEIGEYEAVKKLTVKRDTLGEEMKVVVMETS